MHEDDPFGPQVSAYALGALDADEAAGFEAHLGSGCDACATGLDAHTRALGALGAAQPAEAPEPVVREQLLDLTLAPRAPVDVARFAWDEIAPGVRAHVLREDAARGVRSCLVWADPGARHPLHRHGGDEVILVLQGALRDGRGEYGPGAVCRSRAGSVHSEEAMPGEPCVCFVVYYGELEMLPEA